MLVYWGATLITLDDAPLKDPLFTSNFLFCGWNNYLEIPDKIQYEG